MGRNWSLLLTTGSHVGFKVTKMEQAEIGSQLRRLVIFLGRVDGACPGLATVEEADVGSFLMALETELV